MNIVQFMDKFPIGYQLSAFPLETADNLVYDVLFCLLFFCKQVFCVFSREFQHNSIKSVQCVPLDFFLRDHRRTSPFSNLFKILLDFGTELLLFPDCFISECSVFWFFFVCLFFFLFILYSLSLRLKYQFFTRPPTTHTHFQTLHVQYCGFIPSSLSTKYTLATELLHVC